MLFFGEAPAYEVIGSLNAVDTPFRWFVVCSLARSRERGLHA